MTTSQLPLSTGLASEEADAGRFFSSTAQVLSNFRGLERQGANWHVHDPTASFAVLTLHNDLGSTPQGDRISVRVIQLSPFPCLLMVGHDAGRDGIREENQSDADNEENRTSCCNALMRCFSSATKPPPQKVLRNTPQNTIISHPQASIRLDVGDWVYVTLGVESGEAVKAMETAVRCLDTNKEGEGGRCFTPVMHQRDQRCFVQETVLFG